MNIITNQKKINRNAKIGYWASIFSPVVLMVSAMTLFKYPDQIMQSMIFFMVGSIGFGVGTAYRKYGQGVDLIFNQVLKKLDKEYTIYHFITPVSHLLVGPTGIWILVPKMMRGIVTYNEKRKKWQLGQDKTIRKAVSFMTEGLGNPARDVLSEADSLEKYLRKHWSLEEKPDIQAVLVMVHPETVVDADNAPIPTVHATKLRAFFREQEKSGTVSNTILREFNQLFIKEETQ